LKNGQGFVSRIGWLVLLFLTLLHCSKVKNGPGERERLKLETEQKILGLAYQYEADTNWLSKVGIDTSGMLVSPYTLQLQRALVKSDGQPVVVVAGFRDVMKKGNTYYAVFNYEKYESAFPLPSIRFILSCDSNAVSTLMRQPVEPDLSDQFAIIATIDDVRRPEFYVKADPIDEYGAEIELQTSDTFLATGKLIDFLFVGDYEGSGRF